MDNALFVEPKQSNENTQPFSIVNGNALQPNVPMFIPKVAPTKKAIPKILETKKGLYGNIHKLATGTELRDVHPKLKTEIATVYKNNPQLTKGVIESLLMKESSMGYDNSNKNLDIGDYAWLVGFTKIAKKELMRNGIAVDLRTKQGALDAAAKFWMLKHKGDDVVDTYNQEYSSGKLTDKQLGQFKDMFDYYSSK